MVGDGIRAYLGLLRTTLINPYDLAIATAYFNLGGYQLLADELDHPARVRILLGAEPPEPERRLRSLSEPRTQRQQIRRALEGHAQDLRADSDLLGFTLEVSKGAERLIEWLRSDRVEVRRLRDRFLHGKAFVVTTDDAGVIAGSANFTYAGMSKNLELALGNYDPPTVKRVSGWFEELWAEAEDYDLASIYDARFEPHTPYVIYLRMLWERYASELAEEAGVAPGGVIHLTRFQEDGLWRARRILAQRNGVLIADEVGLGKTFLAGELIREAIEGRRQRVLLVAPATLRNGPWRTFNARHQLGVECISLRRNGRGKPSVPGRRVRHGRCGRGSQPEEPKRSAPRHCGGFSREPRLSNSCFSQRLREQQPVGSLLPARLLPEERLSLRQRRDSFAPTITSPRAMALNPDDSHLSTFSTFLMTLPCGVRGPSLSAITQRIAS